MTTTVYSFTSPPLELRIKLNATTITPGEGVLAQISLFNPLPFNYTFAPSYTAYSTIESWNEYDSFCPTATLYNTVWSYALFQGSWSAGNISSAGDPLTLYPPVYIGCPAFPIVYLLTFLPRNNTAITYFGGYMQAAVGLPVRFQLDATTEFCSDNQCGIGSTLLGFWNTTGLPCCVQWENGTTGFQNATIYSPYFHLFPPGEYTLVAEDAWGQATYAYFQVVPR
jgi:hypothetical protein